MIKKYLLPMAVVSCMVSCSDTPEPGGPNSTESADFYLSLDIKALNSTRSEGHEGVSGSQEENFIADGDYRVFLFDPSGDYLMEFKPTFTSESIDPITGEYVSTIMGPVTSTYAAFRIMVLANWAGVEAENLYPAGWQPLQTNIKDLYSNTTDYNFNLSNLERTWQPAMLYGRGIPMFGISDMLFYKDAVEAGSSDLVAGKEIEGKILTGKVNLLRSVAKIEIVDNLNEGFVLEKVAFKGATTLGRLIPDVSANLDWNDKLIQVNSASLPQDVGLSIDEDRAFTLRAVSETDEATGKSVTKWVAYLTEGDFPAEICPEISVEFNLDASQSTEDSQGNVFEYDGPKEAVFPAFSDLQGNAIGGSLLRNHIYRYTLNFDETEKMELSVDYTVCEWIDHDTVEIEFN